MKKLLLTFTCLLMLSASQSNAQCTAMFMYWSQSTNPPALVNFMDSSVVSSGPATYLWDFGDGSGTSTTQNPQHTYSANGTYWVCLTVTDSTGCTDMHCDSVYVGPPPPTVGANLYVDSMSMYNCTYPHSATFSYYAYAYGYTTADSLKFEVRFGDGVDSIFYLSLTVSNFQGSISHSYINAGNYTPQITVTGPDQTTATSIGQTIYVSASCGNISGYVYNDLNGNCINDAGEELQGISVAVYQAGQLAGWATTDATGLYSFNLPTSNTYDINVYASNGLSGNFAPTCPSSGILTGVAAPSTGNNFGVACPVGFDLQGSITVWRLRPGFTGSVCVYFYNERCNSPSGQVDVTFPSNLTPLPDSIGTSYTVNGNVVTFPYTGSAYAWSFCVPVLVSLSAQIGDSACIGLNISPIAGDADPSNNTGTFCFPIVNSFDPNDKAVTPAGEGPSGLIRPNTDLTYTIRFQNTGNAEAINIFILDTLSSNLDASSVEVIATSHPMNYSLLTGNILRFSYDNILLADSNSNEPASHGYVTYTVKQISNIAQLAQINNTAGIYFDFNQPVITNTTLNTVDHTLSLVDVENINLSVSIYPNPTNDKCRITFNDNNLKTISVSDVLGKEVFRVSVKANSYLFNTEKFAEGIYTISIINDGTVASGRLLIKH